MFITMGIASIIILGVLYILNIVIAPIHYETTYINNLTTIFSNASVASPFPANSFGYTVSSYAASYAIWVVVIILAGVAIYLAYSIKR